jgi:homoserine dehydrogenase
MQTTHVAIVGLGTVGTGVAKLLREQEERIARRAGKRLVLKRAVVRDLAKPRGIELPAGTLTDDLGAVVSDPEITVVAQLVGGLSPAREIMLRLLESGKDVVTANKALLAAHGTELFERARQLGRSIAFEAAVAGGIPVVAALGQSLTANQITSISAILNGTSNFILTEMATHGKGYDEALARAQQLGYAEADPTMDVDGTDATQKLAILTRLAFGTRVAVADIPRQGIDGLELADLRFADELGYTVKLLATARLDEGEVELHVAPTLVHTGSPMAGVRGAYNAVRLVGDAVGDTLFYGLGAGQMPTASAVVADLIDTAVGRAQITFGTLRLWDDFSAAFPVKSSRPSMGRSYLRFSVADRPSVLAEIAGILGRHHVSIASVIQHEAPEPENDNRVPLVIMTHTASQHDLEIACEEIDQLEAVQAPSVRMRVED